MATSSALTPSLARKVSKILETRTEAPEVLGALGTLSTFYGENTPATRRALRSTIERRGLEINEDFLAAAGAVIQALEGVEAELGAVAAGAAAMAGALGQARTAAAGLAGEAGRVAAELSASRGRSQLVQHFLQQYQLQPDEVAALQARRLGPYAQPGPVPTQGGEIGDAFFEALERVRAIHANCRDLLRAHHQRAGLELMDAMATYQETAYERLCRWMQGECRALGRQDAPDVSPRLARAAGALRERPVLFRYCAEEVAAARHAALFQRFIEALTRGGPGGMPRPIEMHAHEPRRYLSDMLAWVHQALASERELLVALFGEDGERSGGEAAPGATNGQWPPRSSSGSFISPRANASVPAVAALLDHVFESICRPLKVRVEQVLMAPPPPLLCFQAAQLLGFYAATVAALLGPGAQLAEQLGAARGLARRVFNEQLKDRGDKLLRNPPPPPPDLSPPPQLADGLVRLAEVVEAFEESLGGIPGGREEEEFAPVLRAALDPLLAAVESGSEALAPDAPTRVDTGAHLALGARHAYLLNCATAVGATLEGHACCAGRAGEVAAQARGHAGALAAAAAGALLARCGLREVVERVRLYGGARGADGPRMAVDPALPLERVLAALHAFVAALRSDPGALPEFHSVQAPRLREELVASVSQMLANAYEAVYNAVLAAENGYAGDTDLPAALGHTPQQVRTMLGVVDAPSSRANT